MTKIKNTLMVGSIAFASALSGTALAQDDTHGIAQTSAGPTILPEGASFQLGGGVTGFMRQEARDLFGTGGYWDARAILGTRSYLGAELAYVGSARGASATGLTGDASLVGNGAEAALRANLPLDLGRLRLAPFVFGGVGWTHYNIVREDSNNSLIRNSADALTIPVGAGLGASYNGFTFDARFTYRPSFDELVRVANSDDHADLQTWAVGATIGYEI